jgi:hypothetical protein
MKKKSYDYLILRALMDQENILGLLGSIENARRWFAEIADVYDWNGRYWDQRALLESSAGAHAPAYSFAKKSVDLHHHPFSLTTLGAVRCRAAIDEIKQDPDKAWDYFLEGNAALRESEALSASRGHPYEHPFVTFFTKAMEYLESIGPTDIRRRDLDLLKVQWEALASSRADAAAGIRRVVDVKCRQWEKALVRTGRLPR